METPTENENIIFSHKVTSINQQHDLLYSFLKQPLLPK